MLKTIRTMDGNQARSDGSKPTRARGELGFSLVELLIVILVIGIIMGGVFRAIALMQQTSTSQQVKLDLTQQAREFVDQLTQDLRSSGYPNLRNMSQGSVDAAGNLLTYPATPENAVGLIYVNYNQLWFAGNVDGTEQTDPVTGNLNGTANVKIIKYDLIQTGTNCPCLRRSEYLRTAYQDPVTDAQNTTAADQLEIQGVQNGTGWANAIFTAYNPSSGTAITQAIDFTNNASLMATVNSLRVVLAVQSPYKDSTGAYPVTQVISTIALSNCSEAHGSTRSSFSC